MATQEQIENLADTLHANAKTNPEKVGAFVRSFIYDDPDASKMDGVSFTFDEFKAANRIIEDRYKRGEIGE